MAIYAHLYRYFSRRVNTSLLATNATPARDKEAVAPVEVRQGREVVRREMAVGGVVPGHRPVPPPPVVVDVGAAVFFVVAVVVVVVTSS